jgi:hypothetical protein
MAGRGDGKLTEGDLNCMNWLDQINWGIGRGIRQVTEGVENFFLNFLSSLNQGKAEAAPPPWLEPLVLWVARILAVALAIGVIYVAWRVVWPWLQRWRRGGFKTGTQNVRQTGLVRPLAVENWLKQAQAFQAEGNYAQACRCLYMALLIRLEEGEWLRQDPARTDREYLKGLEALWILAKRPSQLQEGFRQLFLTHEQVHYGALDVTPENFQRCQQAYFELEPELTHKPTT